MSYFLLAGPICALAGWDCPRGNRSSALTEVSVDIRQASGEINANIRALRTDLASDDGIFTVSADVDNATDSSNSSSMAIDGDVPADMEEGTSFQFFNLHWPSAGVSFASVAVFLLALAALYGCFLSRCCGVFACCAASGDVCVR